MVEYVAWVKSLPGKPVFAAYPAGFDFLFVYWYLIRFTGASPFSHSALDMKSMAMVLLGTGYRDSTKRNMPREWFGPAPHTHVALDDAIEQGELLCNMLTDAAKLRAAAQTHPGDQSSPDTAGQRVPPTARIAPRDRSGASGVPSAPA